MNLMLQKTTIKNNIFGAKFSAIFKASVSAMIYKCHEIFWTIINSIFIDMMSDLSLVQVPSHHRFYYKTMLKKLSTFTCGRMAMSRSKNISFRVMANAAMPLPAFYSNMFSYGRFAHFFSDLFCSAHPEIIMPWARWIFSFHRFTLSLAAFFGHGSLYYYPKFINRFGTMMRTFYHGLSPNYIGIVA